MYRSASYVQASELHRVRVGTEDDAEGWPGEGEGGGGVMAESVPAVGARVAGNSRSGAATPVTSVGASANQ